MKQIWGIKNCQSVKKALKFLEEKNIAYEFIDYRKNLPTLALIHQWVKIKGMEKVLNKKSTTYRELNLKDQALSEEELIDMMSKNPTLIKRPVLFDNEILEFGFDKEFYETLC